ncbi:ADP-ribose pyrophosphatase YjhB (NUDIX family) [Ciceribacter lividus]|uniref:ADP-ribose pyrophosphatase YjhB (NUDIX family) n=2 Tax=Ciceribacter lividus TaxID=1197950 RepID=A0A6I7HRA0_9HYPH|nr:ADP-ribose pyrophosphatase YjhB (NUDIX family) [Ciceribacter lividus]
MSMTKTSFASASSAIVGRDGRILLVRRLNPPAADLYAFPGGRAEPGETPAETALRELQEETGLRGGNPRLFHFYELAAEAESGTGGFLLSVFLVDVEDETEALAADDAADLGWYRPDEIARLPVPPSILDCLERLARARDDR